MSDDTNSDSGSDSAVSRDRRIDRRKFVGGLGATATAGLAGCSGQQNPGGNGTTATGDGTATPTSSPTPAAPSEGGKPILGMGTAPSTLNPLATSSAYSWTVLEPIYTAGVAAHPDTAKPIPWGFEDWTVKPGNVGTSKPTITAHLRDGLTWSDGKPLTAEDVKFTVNYVKEQEPAGAISATQFASVEDVKVDKPKGTTVHYYLEQKDRAWLTNIVGNYVLPKHRWKDVANFKRYSPRKNGGPIGSGPFTLEDYKWESWFELQTRSEDAIPWNDLDAKNWLHPKGPFIDSLRVEIFGSQNAMVKELLNGNIDQTYGTVPVSDAAKATDDEALTVYKAQSEGWHHHSWNVRRVPFDDRAFRQFLVKMLDQKWVVEGLYKGIGAQAGDYASPKAYSGWRPPSPGEIDSYEGIDVPDLTFPGERGSYNLTQSAIDTARSFLVDNPDAKHDYSIGPAQSGQVNSPDGKAIYVNGKPIGQAHTDNDGTPGQGPLQMSYNPPNKAPKTARIASRWVEALKKVGVPVAGQVQTFNSQLPEVYKKEDFDMFEMGWTDMSWNNDYYKQLFGHWGADLKNESLSTLKYNAMGYTGADDLIKKQATMMKVEPRKPVVKKVLAKLYNDAPTMVTHYAKILQPVTNRFAGRIKAVGGVTNQHTWLNMHKARE